MNHIFAKRGSIACPLRGYIVACALSALSATATVCSSEATTVAVAASADNR
jgi:hypothetical protein